MKKILLILSSILFFTIQAHGVQPIPAVLPEGSVLETDFSQLRYLHGIPKPIKSEGHVILWNSTGIIWQTLSPFPNSILISKRGLYQLQGNLKTAMVKAGGDNAMFNTMTGIFNVHNIDQIKGFAVEHLPSVQNHWAIRLQPQYSQVQNFIQSIIVEGADHITHITISRPNGDHDEIELRNHAVTDNASTLIRELFNE